MNLLMFHRMRTAIQDNASPGDEAQLTAVEGTLRELLMASGVFEEVEVEHTDDPDQLVIALCQFRPFYTERDVAAAARGDLGRPGALPVLGVARRCAPRTGSSSSRPPRGPAPPAAT